MLVFIENSQDEYNNQGQKSFKIGKALKKEKRHYELSERTSLYYLFPARIDTLGASFVLIAGWYFGERPSSLSLLIFIYQLSL